MVTKNEGGGEEHSSSDSVCNCGYRRLFAIWTCPFSEKTHYFCFQCYSFIIGIVSTNRQSGSNVPPLGLFKMLTSLDHFTPSIRHAYSRYEHSQRQYIGADVFISWIGKADQICRMNVQTFDISRIFGGSPGITYWRSYSWEEHFVPLCLFVKTSPVNFPVASGNGNIIFYTKMTCSNCK